MNKRKIFYLSNGKIMISFFKGIVINYCIKENLSILKEFHERQWYTIKRNINKNKKEFMNLV